MQEPIVVATEHKNVDGLRKTSQGVSQGEHVFSGECVHFDADHGIDFQADTTQVNVSMEASNDPGVA